MLNNSNKRVKNLKIKESEAPNQIFYVKIIYMNIYPKY